MSRENYPSDSLWLNAKTWLFLAKGRHFGETPQSVGIPKVSEQANGQAEREQAPTPADYPIAAFKEAKVASETAAGPPNT